MGIHRKVTTLVAALSLTGTQAREGGSLSGRFVFPSRLVAVDAQVGMR
jgi:hypothetical protein